MGDAVIQREEKSTILITDQECFDFMKNAIASHGKACVKDMEEDAAGNPNNPIEDQYWGQGMNAI